MKQKLNVVENLRVDAPDATAIHDVADEAFRDLVRNALADATDDAVVLNGWTVRVNPGNDQQLYVTPGAAFCKETVGGTWTMGQMTAASSTERLLSMAGKPNGTYGVYVRFQYVAGTNANRAKWRPDTTPEREEVFLHATRQLADFELEASIGAPAGSGWFQIVEVVWDGGMVAGDIKDRRKLLFEGAAGGSANPSTSWTFPDFDRNATRSTTGARTLRSWAWSVARRIQELGGRKWYAAPGYGENVRSASSTVLVTRDSADPENAHYLVTTPNKATLEAVFNGGTASDSRTCTEIVPTSGGGRALYTLTAAAAVLSVDKPHEVRGYAEFQRIAGAFVMFTTSSGGSGWRGQIRGLHFSATFGAEALFFFENSADAIVFERCTFDTTLAAGVAKILDFGTAPGRYVFRHCTFKAASGSATDHVVTSTAGTFIFESCNFTGGRYAVQRTDEPLHLSFRDCYVDDLTSLVKAAGANIGLAGIHVANCRTGVISGDALDIDATRTIAVLDGLVLAGGAAVAGDSLRARLSSIYTGALGNNLQRLAQETLGATAGALVTGYDAAGARASGYFSALRLLNVANTLRMVKSSLAATRWVLTDAAEGAETPIASELHAFFHRFGGDASVAAAKLFKMRGEQIPMAWGTIRKEHGAPGAGETIKTACFNGVDTITATLTHVGADDYHQWAISVLPAGEGGLTRYSLFATVSTEWVVADPAVGAFERDAAGVHPRLAAAVSAQTATSFVVQPQVIDQAGAVVGPKGNNFSSVDVPGVYLISWVLFAQPTVAFSP